MCGIAGYSFGNASRVNRTLAAQALLAGIAERGADAVGYAHRADGPLVVHKQRTGASALLDAVILPATTRQALIHVRDYTKGHPTIAANNHPVRHGRVTGIHNGIIANDEELFDRHRITRDQPEMTVDSEAIFALVDAGGTTPGVLEELVGAMAAAWVDEREPRPAPRRARCRTPALARPRAPRGPVRIHPRRARGGRAGAPDDVPEDGGRRGAPPHPRRRRPRRGAPLDARSQLPRG